jgi:hypothetical protein
MAVDNNSTPDDRTANTPASPAQTIEQMLAAHVVPSDIVAIMAEVTPELAREFLATNLPDNRRTPLSAIARLGRVLGVPGRWKLNG